MWGLIPITDVKEAQAAHDADAAAVIDAKRQLASMQQALREITDQDYPNLAKPGESMALNPPQPADPEHWVQVSMDQNLSLLSSRLAADVARESVEVSRSGHLPSVAITAARGVQNDDVNDTFALGGPPASLRYPTSQKSNEIQLQVTVPLFSGGLVQSQVRQAQYNWIAAKDNVQLVSRKTEHLARDSYNGLVSKIAQVNALRQGLESGAGRPAGDAGRLRRGYPHRCRGAGGAAKSGAGADQLRSVALRLSARCDRAAARGRYAGSLDAD